MFWFLFFGVIAMLIWYNSWRRRRLHEVYKQLSKRPLPAIPVLGVAHIFMGSDEDRMEAIKYLGRSAIERGGVVCEWMVNKLYVAVADPETIELLLKTCLDKDDTTIRYCQTITGNGTIFAPLNIWRLRRKIMKPLFSLKNNNSFVQIFAKQSEVCSNLLKKEANKGDFSIWKYMTTYTFDAICENTLGIEINSQMNPEHPFLEGFATILHLVSKRLLSPWLYYDCIYKLFPQYKQLTTLIQYMYSYINELIQKKRKELDGRNLDNASGKKKETFMESLIELSGGEDGYTDLELTEEVLGLILAGNDTTAVGSSNIFLLLSRYPDIQEKVYQELKEVFEDSNRTVTAEDLPKLKYLEAVIKETLRMYPVVPGIVREVKKDVKLPCGVTLVDGIGLLINFWALHRHPKYWGDDAEQFRPERFLEGPLKHPAQFLPFSYSVRNCAGSNYGIMSMKTVVATVIRQHRLLPPTGLSPEEWTKPLRTEFQIMMKHVDKYIVRVESRNNNVGA